MGHREKATCTLVLVALTTLACRSDRAPLAPASTRIYFDDELGLSFAAPAAWTLAREGQSLVLAGPEGDPTQFSTLTLQTVWGAAGDELDSVLLGAYENAKALENLTWLTQQPVTVDGWPALAYLVRFNYNEKTHLRAGTLFWAGDNVVSLEYSAPNSLFASGLDAYELALGTLSVYSRPPHQR